jgi:FAD/FMN-containing dehydrogenase
MRPATTSTRVEQGELGSTLGGAAHASFRQSFRGELVLPSDDSYERARRVWNEAIDKRPALIARCSGVVDVVGAVDFAREHELVIAIRGGGHNVAGLGTQSGDLHDLSGRSTAVAFYD